MQDSVLNREEESVVLRAVAATLQLVFNPCDLGESRTGVGSLLKITSKTNLYVWLEISLYVLNLKCREILNIWFFFASAVSPKEEAGNSSEFNFQILPEFPKHQDSDYLKCTVAFSFSIGHFCPDGLTVPPCPAGSFRPTEEPHTPSSNALCLPGLCHKRCSFLLTSTRAEREKGEIRLQDRQVFTGTVEKDWNLSPQTL